MIGSSPGAAVLERSAPPSRQAPLPPATLPDPESDGIMSLFSLRDAPAWLLSVGVHVAVMLVLFGVKIVTPVETDSSIISTLEDFDRQMTFDETSMVDQVGDGSEVTSLVSAPASATLIAETQKTRVEEQLQNEIKGPEIPVVDEPVLSSTDDLQGRIDRPGSGSTENIGGVEGAIDRLTFELASSLRQKKTLAIWLFDASLSVKPRRDAIADRFENVYRQLESLDVDSDRALKSVVATFGNKFELYTEDAVDDIRPLIPKVRSIPADETGVEHVFYAVGQLVKKFQRYRTQSARNVMIFIITDERGDDMNLMEEVIHQCRRYGIKVYVVGNAAPFSRQQSYTRWTYEGVTELLPMDTGPETVMPEALQLPFWGTSGPSLDQLSSGYGPYALTRLCKESGGLYFIADDNEDHKFDPGLMRTYPPDYLTMRDYEAGLRKNKAKAALVMASTKTNVEKVPVPRLTFRADSDNLLREEITAAQKPAALLDGQLMTIERILAEGVKDRDKVTEPRWRAAYDLAVGRVLAMRTRIFGYNSLLAEMKGLPKQFEKKDNNQWRLVPSKEITAGAQVKKLSKEALKYLNRVIDEHPGTPWALLAERELSQPLGWEWKEGKGNYPSMNENPAQRKKRIRLADEEQKKAAAKAKARAKVRPKL